MSLLRDKNKKQMEELNKTIKKSGGDIQDKVKNSEQTKEDGIDNIMYMDNPFDSNRKIDTFEGFIVNEAKKNKKTKKEKNVLGIDTWVQQLDPQVKGDLDDKLRPMYVNLPNREHRPSCDILRSGKSIKIGNKEGIINGIKNGKVSIDFIDDKTGEHYTEELNIKDVLKKIKK